MSERIDRVVAPLAAGRLVIARSILVDFPEANEAEICVLVDEHKPSSFMDTRSIRRVLCGRYGDKAPMPDNADLDRYYVD